MCVLIFSTTFVWNVSYPKKKWARHDKKMCIRLHSQILYSCPILMNLEFSKQILEKSSNIKFHENPSSGSRIFHADGRRDMAKLIVAFRNFANTPKTPD
jgi:hypothetical protein